MESKAPSAVFIPLYPFAALELVGFPVFTLTFKRAESQVLLPHLEHKS